MTSASGQRATRFWLGAREYDPLHVGFVTEKSPGAFEFDTTLDGNSNEGHEYGAVLSDDERWDLIEYLKTL
ncbi:hypothetical protein K2Z84_20250 [Candidatus Binatia bacterium]|nr:hypothetical protein [Candidatus Binatia bacterium]